MTFKIATWNVNSLRVRLAHVINWLSSSCVHCLAVQETKVMDEEFPVDAFKEVGYEVVFTGQKTYNGVALIAPQVFEDVLIETPFIDNNQRRVISATINGIRVVNVYVPNGAALDSDKYPYKLTWLENLKHYLKEQMAVYDKIIVLGDFNIAPADCDVYDPKAWEGHVLVSPAEREAFETLLALGFKDSFRLHTEEEGCFSWWDYRAAAFRRDRGLRIDHILISDALTKHCTACTIDKEPRTWERPSDHTPVVAEFAF